MQLIIRILFAINICLSLFLAFLLFEQDFFPLHNTASPQYDQHVNDLASLPTPSVIANSEVHMLFVGDIFFDRYIRKVIEDKGEEYIFSCVRPLLQKVDLVVGNLEGPITHHASVSKGSIVGSPENFQFTFATSIAPLLKKEGVDVVSLGNNHISNFGKEGIRMTHEFLEEADVNFFGGLMDDEPIFRYATSGHKFSFISYNQFGGTSSMAVAEAIAREHDKRNVVIVFAHWGDEYVEEPGMLRDIAERFVLSGAHLIIGAHPHVVIPKEYIKGVPVYYSLGNFIFDQYWDQAVRKGMAVSVIFSDSGMTFTEYETQLEYDGRTCFYEPQKQT